MKWLVAVATAELLILAWQPTRINHDAAMYLQAGDLLRSGTRLYVDVIDLNPPLIFYASRGIATVARAVHAPLIPFFLFVTWATSVVSMLATRSLPAHVARG